MKLKKRSKTEIRYIETNDQKKAEQLLKKGYTPVRFEPEDCNMKAPCCLCTMRKSCGLER